MERSQGEIAFGALGVVSAETRRRGVIVVHGLHGLLDRRWRVEVELGPCPLR